MSERFMKIFFGLFISTLLALPACAQVAVRSNGGGGTNNVFTNMSQRVVNSVDGSGITADPLGSALLWRSSAGEFLYTLSPSKFLVYTNAEFRGNSVMLGESNYAARLYGDSFFVPTNLPNAQIVDFSRPMVTTNASANITFTGVANLQPGMENQAIWKIVPDGTYTVSFPSTWKNTAGAGSSYITTNGTHLHILVTAQMGVSTNVARMDYY